MDGALDDRAVDGLLPIGAFARLARLTVKAVRHYDAEGLLLPAHVDPHTAYRYYRADQVRTAATIAVLRGLDVPLPTVREVLSGDPAVVTAALERERDRQRAELARREHALTGIDALLADPGKVRYDVVLGERAAVTLHGVSATVRADALEAGVGALCRSLARVVDVRQPFVAVYPLDLDEELDVSVGVAVEGHERAVRDARRNERTVRAEGTATHTLPTGLWATTLHVGPYSGLPLAYTAVLEHVRALGHTPRGPFTETYLSDPSTSAPEDLVTRLAVALDP